MVTTPAPTQPPEPCKDYKCLNGGKCVAPDDKPKCECYDGFVGTMCENPAPPSPPTGGGISQLAIILIASIGGLILILIIVGVSLACRATNAGDAVVVAKSPSGPPTLLNGNSQTGTIIGSNAIYPTYGTGNPAILQMKQM